jgi:ribulose-5-phosphate 4-epimerase/fuculose-1-phosphate aldolase
LAIIPDSVFQEFVRGCRDVASRGLVRNSSGNLSRRYDEGRLLATATGTRMADLSAEDIAVCRIADGIALNKKRPTAEIGFHAGILRTRPDVHVVLHFQSPCATAIACREGELPDFNLIPEIPCYVGPVASVPYLTPGSTALSEAVTAAAAASDVIVLRNHGVVVAAPNLSAAVQRAEFFDLACDILLRAGTRVSPMPPAGVRDMIERRARESGRSV